MIRRWPQHRIKRMKCFKSHLDNHQMCNLGVFRCVPNACCLVVLVSSSLCDSTRVPTTTQEIATQQYDRQRLFPATRQGSCGKRPANQRTLTPRCPCSSAADCKGSVKLCVVWNPKHFQVLVFLYSSSRQQSSYFLFWLSFPKNAAEYCSRGEIPPPKQRTRREATD